MVQSFNLVCQESSPYRPAPPLPPRLSDRSVGVLNKLVHLGMLTLAAAVVIIVKYQCWNPQEIRGESKLIER